MTDTIIMTTESKLLELIETAMYRFMNMREPAKKTPETNNITGAKYAVDYLNANGYKIAKTRFNEYIGAGLIPYSRFGGQLLFDKRELLSWAERKRQKTGKSEIAPVIARSAQRRLKNRQTDKLKS